MTSATFDPGFLWNTAAITSPIVVTVGAYFLNSTVRSLWSKLFFVSAVVFCLALPISIGMGKLFARKDFEYQWMNWLAMNIDIAIPIGFWIMSCLFLATTLSMRKTK